MAHIVHSEAGHGQKWSIRTATQPLLASAAGGLPPPLYSGCGDGEILLTRAIELNGADSGKILIAQPPSNTALQK